MQRFPAKWRSVFVLLGLIGLLFLVMNFNQRMADYDRLDRQLGAVRTEATAIMQTQETLLTQLAYATSAESVEEWAYENGRWARPGENPIVPVPAGEVATPTPVSPSPQAAQHPSNWRIWWELLFGDHD